LFGKPDFCRGNCVTNIIDGAHLNFYRKKFTEPGYCYPMLKSSKFFLLFSILLLATAEIRAVNPVENSDPKRETLGLTLSGGAARGLAHIGVLHIIDSLGIELDYLTGTSMGAIVGGMYASGYTAREIEEMALRTNWNTLFSSEVNLEFIHPVNRREAGKYLFSRPFEDGRLKFETGALEGQQLWNELSTNFLHVSHIRDFNDLPIPFACVATDLETGETVVLRNGIISTAIRASMAVPAVFTAVEIDGKKLIDGGVSNNFPVDVAYEIGADKVLGVNVARGLRSADQLRNPLDVILQVGFFSDAKTFASNKEKATWFLDIPLEGIEANDFDQVKKIIELGKREARKNLELFEEIAASQAERKTERFTKKPASVQYKMRSIEFRGLESASEDMARQAFPLKEGDKATSSQVLRAVRILYATGLFDRIYVFAEKREDENTDLVIDLLEKSLVRVGGLLGYNDHLGVWIGGGIQLENPIWNNTQAEGRLHIGENPTLLGRKRFFLDDHRSNWITAEMEGSLIRFPYEGHSQPVDYRRTLFKASVEYSSLRGRDSYWSVSIGRRIKKLSQRNNADVNINGWINGWKVGVKWERYTLDRHAFPTKGQDLYFSLSHNFGYRHSLSLKKEGYEDPELRDLDLSMIDYQNLHAKWLEYVPLSDKYTAHFLIEFARLMTQQGFITFYNIGGYRPVVDRQFTMLGLREYQFMDDSYISGRIGIQRALGERFFASAMMQAGSWGFRLIPFLPTEWPHHDYVLGWGISLGYLSRVGPVETTFSYSPEMGRLVGYVNLGWSF